MNNIFAIKKISDGNFQLVHRPSGELIQLHNCNFSRVSDAAKVRDAMREAAPDWDFSDPELFAEMPTELFHKVWHAIYNAK